MKVALIPLKTYFKKPKVNWQHFESVTKKLLSKNQIDLICLPECTFTGYLYKPDDLSRFAEPILGLTSGKMASLASQLQVSICFGLVEQTSAGIFNTAVLIGRDGSIQMVQRKLSEKPPFTLDERVYSAETEFGKVSILTCGDLFYDKAI